MPLPGIEPGFAEPQSAVITTILQQHLQKDENN